MSNSLSDVQQKILKIYKEFQRICEKYNLRYFAIGGTAIGAVRHNGFIPWDDDMDLGMPVEDFLKFEKICKKELPKNLSYISIPTMGGKIHDTSTTFLEAACYKYLDNYYGVFLDIFPLVALPDNAQKRSDFIDEIHRYNIEALMYYHYRDVAKYNKKFIDDWKSKLMSAYKLSDVNKMMEFSINYHFTTSTKGIKNPIKMKFEDTLVPVFSNYDEYLTAHYGNYMQLPPLKDRVRHDDYGIIDLRKPFIYYWNKKEENSPEIKKLLEKKHDLEGKNFYSMALGHITIAEKNWQIQRLVEQVSSLKEVYSSKTMLVGKIILSPINLLRKIFRRG